MFLGFLGRVGFLRRVPSSEFFRARGLGGSGGGSEIIWIIRQGKAPAQGAGVFFGGDCKRALRLGFGGGSEGGSGGGSGGDSGGGSGNFGRIGEGIDYLLLFAEDFGEAPINRRLGNGIIDVDCRFLTDSMQSVLCLD
jgi:hypothetical protein